MKKFLLIMFAAVIAVSCEKSDMGFSELEETSANVYSFRIDLGSWGTRGDMTADETEMTDLWVFDYMNGECKQSVALTPMSTDWGEPTLTLITGDHDLYFVAARGDDPEVDENGGTIIWGTPKDAFLGTLSLTVAGGNGGTRAVTLSRIATKMKVAVTDVVPEGTATLSVTPERWFFGINYLTGEAVSEQKKERTVNVPAAYIGTSRKLVASFFGISDDEEWMTDVVLKAAKSDGTVLGSATIANAPFKRNRISEFSGNLFNGQSTMDVTLDGTWIADHIGEW